MPRWTRADLLGRRPSRRPHGPTLARLLPRWTRADLLGRHPSRRPHGPTLALLLPRWTRASLLAAALAACARPPVVHTLVTPLGLDPIRQAAAARATATAFILEEARGDEAADTLLEPGAVLISNGVEVSARPRLAGVIGPGEGAVEALATQLAGDVAWIVATYRWVGPGSADERRARATIILELRPAGWRIRHVHSSAVAPWQ